MVVVSEGSFMMGADATEPDRQTDEGPVRTVSIQRAFAIGKYEVTQVEWNACVTDGGCPVLLNVENAQMERPVANVSWSDTRSYAAWLSSKTGNRYFLPSEAKWEYASRAGTTTP
jgi:formylglycine-generating enzyme required for sulfatase activity